MRTRHLPGAALTGWGLALLLFSAWFSAVGLGGSGAGGSLFFAMFLGLCMIGYGIYRRIGGSNVLQKLWDDSPGDREN
ncbi:hypothetical protein ACQ3I4_00260 [Zafaria sp. Z1313]|uniref:hypothetical protein n=1 Tax=unclassified Zafaria TaxID=2828765 RepID=UPI002E79521D|nr:hypothetical protein [Zafaria sp. J156]MEE1619818.1 hypothetical protein [Zafaria sp. J156]